MRNLRLLAIAFVLVSPIAAADEDTPPAPPAPAPEGRDFGQHVSGMAPEHAILHGALFGECVSEMALNGECPHHEDDE